MKVYRYQPVSDQYTAYRAQESEEAPIQELDPVPVYLGRIA